MMTELNAELSAIGKRADARAVIIAGNGPAFSAGHDLGELKGRDLAFYRYEFDLCAQLMQTIQRIPQPVIARVHAIATAAGCQLAGREKVAKMIGSIIAPAKKVEFKLLNLFGFGNKVVTERLDCWDWDGSGFTLKLPVCGMFELNEAGKIYEWREYYDNEHWTKYGGPSLVL
jgi:limonene-1,2-epoxide hydrolase